jgi:hypothetical protein
MPKIYFYKLTADNGGAPCVQNGLLSLAICKPMIRRTADEQNIVIGFAANSLHPDNRLIYVARVNGKLCNGDYYRLAKHKSRRDCIYEWRGGRFVERANALYHGSPGDLVHDLGSYPGYARASTLLSREFCYFGASGSDAYKQAFPIVAKAVAALGRGHRVHHDSNLLGALEKLANWSCSLEKASVCGAPTSPPQRGISLRGGGCGVAERSC